MQTQKTSDNYYCASKTLFNSSLAVNLKNKTAIKITPRIKLVYTYMRDQFVMFESLNQKYFESVEKIILQIGLKPTAGKRAIADLKELGLIQQISKKGRSNVYRVLDIVAIKDWRFSNPELEKFNSQEDIIKPAPPKQEPVKPKQEPEQEEDPFAIDELEQVTPKPSSTQNTIDLIKEIAVDGSEGAKQELITLGKNELADFNDEEIEVMSIDLHSWLKNKHKLEDYEADPFA